MAIAVESFNYAIGSNVINLTVPAPSGITSGDFLYIIAMRDPISDLSGYDFSASGWTQHLRHWTSLDVQIQTLYKVSDGTEGSVTLTSSLERDTVVWYLRISGVDTSSPFNVNGTFADDITPVTIPSVTTTVNGCLAFTLFAFDGGDGDPFTLTGTGWPSSIPTNQYLEEDVIGSSISGFWITKEIVTSGTSESLSVNSSTLDGMGGVQFALTPASVVAPSLNISGVNYNSIASLSGSSKLSVASVSGVSVV